RKSPDGFYITGSGTGGIEMLEEKHISLVNGWSHEENWVRCTGEINASAESLSHAAIYEAIPGARAVIHIHHKGMWDKFIHVLPTTSPNVLYGTPKMANEVRRIALTMTSDQDSILVMGGHEEGIIAWGKSIHEAGETLWKYFLNYQERN
ncbi:MAG: class II aldolase/adducin family protein, partial [Pedobacter sp.]